MFKFCSKSFLHAEPRLLEEEPNDEIQKLAVVSDFNERVLSEADGHVNPSYGHSFEHLSDKAKHHSLQQENSRSDNSESNDITDGLEWKGTAPKADDLPRSSSINSLKSSSTVSDSKPDVVKCTRHKHSQADECSSVNDFDISVEVRQRSPESGVEVRQRHHSCGDEPHSLNSEINGRTKSEDFMLGRRDASFRANDCRKRSGLWTTEVDPTNTDGIWMTEVAPQNNDIIDEEEQEQWRLSLDRFTSKRQGSKRKAKHVSKRMRSYYKCQDELIKSFEILRYDMEEDKVDMDELMRRVSFYAKITFFVNLLLLVIKIVAVGLSGSVSLISSLVDSSVDLISGVVIWVTTRLVRKTDRFQYPQGRAKLEPIAIVILSVIMAVASLHLIEETIEKMVHLATGESEPPTMDWITIGISSVTVVVKLVLYLVCRKFSHHTIQALAQDHRNDVVSNSAAIIFGYIGSKQMQRQNNARGLIFLDPIGAVLICIYISLSWCHTGWVSWFSCSQDTGCILYGWAAVIGQIKMLTGHTATPEFLSKITWISLDHHKKIRKINSVRAFHFGNNFLVEVEIVLPAFMTVEEAHNIAEPLEQKLEKLVEVERAFIHIDYETAEHMTNNTYLL